MYTWRSNTVSRSFNAMCALIGGSRKAMRCQNNARAANAGLRSGTIKRHQQPRRTRSRPQYRPCSQLLACPPLTAPPLSDTRPSFLAARRTACRSFETMKPASGPVASQNAVIVSMMKPSSSPLRPLTSHPSDGDHPDLTIHQIELTHAGRSPTWTIRPSPPAMQNSPATIANPSRRRLSADR